MREIINESSLGEIKAVRIHIPKGSVTNSPHARDVDFEIKYSRIYKVSGEVFKTQQELIQRQPCNLFVGVLMNIDFEFVIAVLKGAMLDSLGRVKSETCGDLVDGSFHGLENQS